MMGNGPADEAILAQHVAALDATLAVYDGILAKQSYLAGEELTAADLNHLPYGRMARSVGYKELWDKYPNVKRWWKSLEERESWQKIIS
jgi:glutathione S-transferase